MPVLLDPSLWNAWSLAVFKSRAVQQARVSFMKIIKCIVAVVCIVGGATCLGVKFWADGEAFSVAGPSYMRITPAGELAILIGQTIVIIGPDNQTRRSIELPSLGIHTHGDFDFFSNGDLLVYHGDQELTTWQSIKRFLRLRESRQSPPQADKGLLRCNGEGKSCRLFSAALPAFYSAFHLYVDRQSDTVYIADTPRFTLYKLDRAGELLADSSQGLRFPNRVLLKDNLLYLVNTNYNAIDVVHAGTEQFGEPIERFNVIIGHRYRWPAELLATKSNWWVIIADKGMRLGRIKVYDLQWDDLYTLQLQKNADPVGMIYYQDTVWITDWSNRVIYRFSPSGKQLANFSNEQVDAVFAKASQQVESFKAISRYALIAFVAVIVLGVIAAWVLEKQQTLDVIFARRSNLPAIEKTAVPLPNPPGEGVYWIESHLKKHVNSAKYGGFTLAVLIVFAYCEPFLFNKNVDFVGGIYLLASVLVALGLIALLCWLLITVARTKIGVSGELLLIDDGRGNVGIGKGSAVKYGETILWVDGVAVLLGRPVKPLFPRSELDQWVIPRMQLGQAVGQWEALRLFCQSKR